jgi:hypothetical protein
LQNGDEHGKGGRAGGRCTRQFTFMAAAAASGKRRLAEDALTCPGKGFTRVDLLAWDRWCGFGLTKIRWRGGRGIWAVCAVCMERCRLTAKLARGGVTAARISSPSVSVSVVTVAA